MTLSKFLTKLFKRSETAPPGNRFADKSKPILAGIMVFASITTAPQQASAFSFFQANSGGTVPLGTCTMDAGGTFNANGQNSSGDRDVTLWQGAPNASTVLYRQRAVYANGNRIGSASRETFAGYSAIETACNVTNVTLIREFIPTPGIAWNPLSAACGPNPSTPCSFNANANNTWMRTVFTFRDSGGVLRQVEKSIRQFAPGNDVNLSSNTTPNLTVAPRPTVANGPAVVTGTTPFTVTVTFNDPVTDFDDLTDLTVLGGEVTSIVPNGTLNQFTVTIDPDGTGTVTIDVPEDVAVSRTNGVDNVASNQLVIPFTNGQAPTPTVSGGPALIDDATPIAVLVTFDEEVTGFDVIGDVTVTGGSVNSITPTGNPNEYSVAITPTGTEDVTVQVPTAVATDVDDGNDNLVSNLLIITFGGDELLNEQISEVLSDDLFETTRMLSQNASAISRRAADRIRFDRGQACGQRINELLQDTPVRFANDSFVIDAANNQMLDEITEILNDCVTSSFSIDGHTDSDASDAYNVTLSLNRVRAVKAALVSRGIADGRLQTRGFGESRPIATNATEEGQALNRRVEFILLDTAEEPIAQSCTNGRPFGGSLDGNANDDGARINGLFGSEGYNCVTGELTETWGALNVVRDDNIGTQGMASFGMSKERQSNGVLSGRFVEGYVSRTEVDNGTVEGDITGVGVHAGLYGARATEGGLVMSYYGSAAVGRHAFELSAASDADGSYMYAGVFAGGAVTGEQDLGSSTLKPRVGVDLGYSKSFGEDISNTGTLEIEPATYARGFVELGLLTETGQGAAGEVSTFEVAPRAFCEATDTTDADACGYGARVNYTGAKSAAGAQWDVAFDYETIGDRNASSFSVSLAQDIMDGMGVSQSSFGASNSGALEAAQTVSFSW